MSDRGSRGLHCTKNTLCWTPAFPLGIWNLSARQAEGATWSAPNKNSRHWVSNVFLWLATLHIYCHNSLLRKLSAFCVTLPGHDWKLELVPPNFALWAFSFCWFCFMPFPLRNHTHEYNCMPQPVGPLNLGVVFGGPSTNCDCILIYMWNLLLFNQMLKLWFF